MFKEQIVQALFRHLGSLSKSVPEAHFLKTIFNWEIGVHTIFQSFRAVKYALV